MVGWLFFMVTSRAWLPGVFLFNQHKHKAHMKTIMFRPPNTKRARELAKLIARNDSKHSNEIHYVIDWFVPTIGKKYEHQINVCKHYELPARGFEILFTFHKGKQKTNPS